MTRIFVCLLLISLAGTPPPAVRLARAKLLEDTPQIRARRARLSADLRRCQQLYSAAELDDAAGLAQKSYRTALQSGDEQMAIQFLKVFGNCRFRQYRHQEALQAYLRAREMAESTGSSSLSVSLNINISSLYSQLGQTDMAVWTGERALKLLAGRDPSKYLPSLLIHMGNLRAEQSRVPQALDLFRRGLAAADRAGDTGLCALGWDRVGKLYAERGDLRRAERAMLESYRLRRLGDATGIEISYRDLGKLRLEQGDVSSAAVLLDQALELSTRPGLLLPGWSLYYYRGRVRLAQGRLTEALADLRTAVGLVRVWRRATPGGDSARMGIENWQDVARLYGTLVEAGNRLYFATGRRPLAEETFVAAEENRAASLRALLAEPRDWGRRLPPGYAETLRQLESAEIQLVRHKDSAALARMRQLQASLMQWEAVAQSNSPLEMPGLLAHVQRSLGLDQALLSFHLASPNSYIWAVSRSNFAVYRLPAAGEIGEMAGRFAKAVREGGADAAPVGRELFRTLFGQLAPEFQAKPRWLLALDSPLFELPLAALPVEAKAAEPVYLIARHSIETTPGAGMLAAEGGAKRPLDGRFVGIADAVYNAADPRWAKPAADDLHLARLAGSAHEIEECARAWGGSQAPQLLEGREASRRQIEAALESHPAVVHFATHVLHSADHPRSGLIILSLAGNGQNEILNAAEIATWHLDGALVSLSGCSSGSADALAGTGLMGLTRAWLAAGAQAVVASRWPAPDEGALFSAFYGQLRRAPKAGAAGALQTAQLEMIRSGTWRSNPRYWGAYFVAGN